jgi:hypothetical protein
MKAEDDRKCTVNWNTHSHNGNTDLHRQTTLRWYVPPQCVTTVLGDGAVAVVETKAKEPARHQLISGYYLSTGILRTHLFLSRREFKNIFVASLESEKENPSHFLSEFERELVVANRK